MLTRLHILERSITTQIQTRAFISHKNDSALAKQTYNYRHCY